MVELQDGPLHHNWEGLSRSGVNCTITLDQLHDRIAPLERHGIAPDSLDFRARPAAIPPTAAGNGVGTGCALAFGHHLHAK